MKLNIVLWTVANAASLFLSVDGFATPRIVTRNNINNVKSVLSAKDADTDEAPCLDGVCASTPPVKSDNSNDQQPSMTMGEATMRLGQMTGPTVWTEFGRLSQEHDVANLGQGFPDWLPPKFAVDSLVEAALDSAQSPHQYTRTAGHPNLVKQLAKRYGVHMKRAIDPMNEVSVTIGASQALYLSLQTLIKPGM